MNRHLLVTSFITAFALALVLGAFLFLERDVVRSLEFIPGSKERALYPMEREEGSWRYTTPVRMVLPPSWDEVQRLYVEVTVSEYYVPASGITIELTDRSCRFESRQQYLSRDDTLEFLLVGNCAELNAGDEVRGVLSVDFSSIASISVVGFRSGKNDSGLLRTDDPHHNFSIHGRFDIRSAPQKARLVDQLAAIWDLPAVRYLLPGVIVFDALLLCLGGFVLSLPRFRWKRVVACGAFALALASTYSIFVPPFQAPDEPDHFLSFSRIAQLPELEIGARELAKVGHFERIHFHSWQRFLPEDFGRPYPEPWALSSDYPNYHVRDSVMEHRSALTVSFWKAIGPAFKGMSAPSALLSLRLINSLLWMLACVICMILIEKIVPQYRQTFPLYLFVIPTLPLFAVHVSNYSHFTQALTVVTGLGLAIFLRGRKCDWCGLLLGLASSLLLLTATTGSTLLAWTLAMLVARVVLALSDRQVTFRSAALYWFGLALGLAPLLLFAHSEEFELLAKAFGKFASMVGLPQALSDTLTKAPALCVLSAAAAFIGMLVEYGASRLRPIARRIADTAALFSLRIIAVFFALFLLLSAFQNFSQVPKELSIIGAHEYMRLAIAGLLSAFTFREPDIMLSLTFWSGFGWHDAFFPGWLVRLLAGTTGIGILLAMIRVHRDPDRSIRLLCHIAGAFFVAVSIIVLISSGISGGHPNVHGRYLISFYLLMLSVSIAALTPFMVGSKANQLQADASAPSRLRTSLETLVAWGCLVAMCFCPFLLREKHVSVGLGVYIFWPYAVITIAIPLACAAALAILLRTPAGPGHVYRNIAPRSGFVVALMLVIFAVLGIIELFVGLPKALSYNLDFYVVLVTTLAALRVALLAEPAFMAPKRWLVPATLVILVTLHVGSLLFLMTRYFG